VHQLAVGLSALKTYIIRLQAILPSAQTSVELI